MEDRGSKRDGKESYSSLCLVAWTSLKNRGIRGELIN
jgi:hypothetical protein